MSADRASGPETEVRPVPDPRGVRVSLAPGSAMPDVPPLVIEPPAIPVVPSPDRAPRLGDGRGPVAGASRLAEDRHGEDRPGEDRAADDRPGDARPDARDGLGIVLVDGTPVPVALDRQGDVRVRLRLAAPPADGASVPDSPEDRYQVLLLDTSPLSPAGPARRVEVVVDGWRIEVDVESERRAALRERAARGRADAAHTGPTEVHAIIPGVIVSVSVVPGAEVTAGEQLLVVEAMKMQNELRAPRDGRIERVAVSVGQTIEVGTLLLVIE